MLCENVETYQRARNLKIIGSGEGWERNVVFYCKYSIQYYFLIKVVYINMCMCNFCREKVREV